MPSSSENVLEAAGCDRLQVVALAPEVALHQDQEIAHGLGFKRRDRLAVEVAGQGVGVGRRSHLLRTRICGFLASSKLAQDALDGLDVKLSVGIRGIDDMQQEVGFVEFFEVALKAATSVGGRSRIKPTVSVMMISRLRGNLSPAAGGVEGREELCPPLKTADFVRVLRRVLFPALV